MLNLIRASKRAQGLGRVVIAAALVALASPAQSPFVNFEPGQVAPIATSTLGSGGAVRHILLVCNTADNRLEVLDAQDPSVVLGRIPTGLAPVTVRVRKVAPDQLLAYTCNHIGDSVTLGSIDATGVDGSGSVVVQAELEFTKSVGDEPSDIAFIEGQSQAIVSLRSRSAVAILDLPTLDVVMGQQRHLVSKDLGAFQIALKHPTQLLLDTGGTRNRLFVLDKSSDQDRLDLVIADTNNPGTNPMLDGGAVRRFSSNMGTTRHAFALDSNGSQLFVVGMAARTEVLTEPALEALETGFVQSWLWVADAPNGSTATRRNEPVPLGSPSAMPSINLNRNYDMSGLKGVDPADALSQPTSVALIEDASGVQAVVIAAFSSDKVAVLRPNQSVSRGWDIDDVTIPALPGHSMSGPRGLCVDMTMTAPGASAPGVVFVSSLDNSVVVINPHDPVGPSILSQTALPHDPTPTIVREGRTFLYSAAHSGNGTVSCASCHVDAHTDGLAWDLGTPGDPEPPIPPSLDDFGLSFNTFPAAKEKIITQPLRGLVNYDIAGEAPQLLATNAPYHWRGDRARFQDFNGAFENLLGGSMIDPDDMDVFTEFIETVPHPPNPEQTRTRELFGDIGTLMDPMGDPYYEPGSGDGAVRGLKLYHEFATIGGLTCVLCHATPEGSNNRITEAFLGDPTVDVTTNPIETAALRHVFDREATIITDFSVPAPTNTAGWDPSDVRAKVVGLFHDVSRTALGKAFGRSLNQFIAYRFDFPSGNCGAGNPAACAEAEDLIEFVRTLDTGTSPTIGLVDQLDGGGPSQTILDMIAQAGEANCGVVVQQVQSGDSIGWWLDVASGLYRRPGTTQTQSLAGLQGLASLGSTIEFQAVPVGSERTIAAGSVSFSLETGPAPSGVTLEPMAMATHWARAGEMVGHWDPNHPNVSFPGTPRPVHQAILTLQESLVDAYAAGSDFGVHDRRQEPPRRMRVAGDGIRFGATLRLWMANEVIPDSTFQILELPLFATDHVTNDGRRIWETSVEFDGEMTMALLHGGPFVKNVSRILALEPGLEADDFDPAVTNLFLMTVINEDGTTFRPFRTSLSVDYQR